MQVNRRILLAFHLPEALRDILAGISIYAKKNDCRWQVECVNPQDFHLAFKQRMVDGAITALPRDSRSLIDRLQRSSTPVVNVLRDLHPRLPSVLSDNRAIGRLGALHLKERGFKQLAFVGIDTIWSRDRQAGFVEYLSEAGLPSPILIKKLKMADFDYSTKVRGRQILGRRVCALPRGIAVMAPSDFISRTLLTACEDEAVAVPRDLAILGVDNFLGVCELAPVPLTSIAQDFVGIGREAAAILDRLMRSKRAVPKASVLLPPGRVHVRKSTDVLAFEDPLVAAALEIIQQRADRGLSMKELLADVPLSRKWLDMRFKKLVGRTPSEEIRRCRLEAVRDLLIDTDMSLAQIAARTRFARVPNLIRCFQAAFGDSPHAYRLKARGSAPARA